jgi:hypothetical protein
VRRQTDAASVEVHTGIARLRGPRWGTLHHPKRHGFTEVMGFLVSLLQKPWADMHLQATEQMIHTHGHARPTGVCRHRWGSLVPQSEDMPHAGDALLLAVLIPGKISLGDREHDEQRGDQDAAVGADGDEKFDNPGASRREDSRHPASGRACGRSRA